MFTMPFRTLVHQVARPLAKLWSVTRTKRRSCRARSRASFFVQSLEDRTLLGGFQVTYQNDPFVSQQGPQPISILPLNSGDGTWAGAIQAVAVTKSGELLAGSPYGGVWENDQPNVWIGPIYPLSAVSFLAVDPNDGSIWVGTGELSSVGQNGPDDFSDGLYRISNLDTPQMSVARLGLDLAGVNDKIRAVVPTTLTQNGKEIVLVATDNQGVMVSTDGGVSFQPIVDKDNGKTLQGACSSLVEDPVDSNRFYAAVPNSGVFQIDHSAGGWTWLALGRNFSNITQAVDIKLATAKEIIVDPKTGLSSFVSILDVATAAPKTTITDPAVTTQVNDVFQYQVPQNGSTSWIDLDPTGQLLQDQLPVDSSAGHFALAADPSFPTVVYVGGYWNSIFRGTLANGTTTWTNMDSVNGTDTHADVRCLMVLNDDTLVAGCDGGVYELHDPSNPGNGDKWTPVNGGPFTGLGVTEFTHVAYDPLNGVILGGAQDVGTSVQPAQYSTSWTEVGGGDGSWVGADAQGNHYWWAHNTPTLIQNGNAKGLSGLNVADQGTDKQGNPTGHPSGDFPFVVGLSSSAPLLIGNNHLYESFDGGDHLTDVTPPGMTGTISAMAYTASMYNYAWAGTSKGELFIRSTFPGSFVAVSSPTTSAIASIAVDPNNIETACILANNQVFETTDGGTSWLPLTYDLAQASASMNNLSQLNTIALADGVPIVGGYGGIYRLLTYSDGPHWTHYGFLDNPMIDNHENQGLVMDLHYIPPNQNDPTKGDLLVGGTLGLGAFTVANVSQSVTNPVVLQINADQGDSIRLTLLPANPSLVEVDRNNQFWGAWPLSEISGINVIGTGGNVLTVDENTGYIRPTHMDPNRTSYISFDGGAGNSTLIIDDSRDVNTKNYFLGNGVADLGNGGGLIQFADISYQNATAHLKDNPQNKTIVIDGTSAATEVDAGPGNNHILIEATTAPVTIHDTGGGNDIVDVGLNNSVQQIDGLISVSGVTAKSEFTLHVNNSADAGKRTADILASGIYGLAPSPIVFDPTALKALDIYGGSAADVYTIHNTPGTFLGSDQFGTGDVTANQIATTVAGLTGISTAVLTANPIVNGMIHDLSDLVTNVAVGKEGYTVNQVAVSISDLIAQLVVRNATAVKHDVVTTLQTGRLNDMVHVLGTNGTLCLLNTGSYDTVLIGDLQRVVVGDTPPTGGIGVQHIRGPIFVKLLPNQGGGGKGGNAVAGGPPAALTYLTVADGADTTGRTTTINQQTITGLAPAVIHYDQRALASLTLWCGSGGNQFIIANTPDNPVVDGPLTRLPTTLHTGLGANNVTVRATTGSLFIDGQGTKDSVQVADTTKTLNVLQGSLSVLGNGSTQLTLDDQNTVGGRHYQLTGATFQFAANLPAVELDSLADLILNAAPAASVAIEGSQSNTSTHVFLNTGSNAVVVGSVANQNPPQPIPQIPPLIADTLDALFGPVSVTGMTGADPLTIRDQNEPVPVVYTISSTTIGSSVSAAITFHNMGAVFLNGGQMLPIYQVQSVPPKTPVVIHGQGSVNQLIGPNQDNTWKITGFNAGTLDKNIRFYGIQNLTGAGGNDDFVFGPDDALSGFLDGGQGNNTLDLAAYAKGVAVFLDARGSQDGILGSASPAIGQGFTNIDSIVGNSASTIDGSQFMGDWTTALQTSGFGPFTLDVPGSFSGQLETTGLSKVQVGEFTGQIVTAKDIGTFDADGNFSGSVLARSMNSVFILGNFSGQIVVNKSFGSLTVIGSTAPTAHVWIQRTGAFTVDNQGRLVGQAASNLATVNGVHVSDVTMQAVVSLTANQLAGLVGRYDATTNSMYLAMLQNNGNGMFTASVAKIQNGQVKQVLAAKKVSLGSGALSLHILTTSSGVSLQFFQGNTLLVGALDAKPLSGDGVGILAGRGTQIADYTAS
jgi:hypothetical protein